MLRAGGPVSKLRLGARFPNVIKREIRRFSAVRADLTVSSAIIFPPVIVCQCAPLYEPAWWNVPARQPFNNCYNYATNYRTNTFAQPGRAAGAMYGALTCAAVKPAAVKDELIDSPGANNKCPGEGHLVALVIWPGNDYHWYRKGRNGLWTHKPGGTAVTNLDNGGGRSLIRERRIAARTRSFARSWSSCMDTSGSPDDNRWIAHAEIYSGGPTLPGYCSRKSWPPSIACGSDEAIHGLAAAAAAARLSRLSRQPRRRRVLRVRRRGDADRRINRRRSAPMPARRSNGACLRARPQERFRSVRSRDRRRSAPRLARPIRMHA